eukprot:15505236-Heterocapsa_arctica.AAC.2
MICPSDRIHRLAKSLQKHINYTVYSVVQIALPNVATYSWQALDIARIFRCTVQLIGTDRISSMLSLSADATFIPNKSKH